MKRLNPGRPAMKRLILVMLSCLVIAEAQAQKEEIWGAVKKRKRTMGNRPYI